MIKRPRVLQGETWTEYTGPNQEARIIAYPVYPKEGYAWFEVTSTPADGDTIAVTALGHLVGGSSSESQTWTFRTTPTAPYEIQIDSNPEILAGNIANAINSEWSAYVKARADGPIVTIYHLVPGAGNDVTVTLTGPSWTVQSYSGNNGALDFANQTYTFVYKDAPNATASTATVTLAAYATTDNVTTITSDIDTQLIAATITVRRSLDNRAVIDIENTSWNPANVFVGDEITNGTATAKVIGVYGASSVLYVENMDGSFSAGETVSTDKGVVGNILGINRSFTIEIIVNDSNPQPNDYIYVQSAPSTGPLLFREGWSGVSKITNDVSNDDTSTAPFVRLYHPADPVYWRTLNRPLIDLASNDLSLYKEISAIKDGIDGETNEPLTEPVTFGAKIGYRFDGPVRFLDSVVFENNNPIIQNVTSLTVSNRTITLNDGETSGGVSGDGIAGIVIDRGTLEDRKFTWNETNSQWELDYQLNLSGGIEISSVTDTFAGTAWSKSVYIDIGSGTADYGTIIFDSSSTAGSPPANQYAWAIGRTTWDENNASRSAFRFLSIDTTTSSFETPIEIRRNATLKQVTFDPYNAGWSTSFVGDVVFNAITSFSSTSNVTFSGTNTFSNSSSVTFDGTNTFNSQVTFNDLTIHNDGLYAQQGANNTIYLGGVNLQVQGDIWRTTNTLDPSYAKLINVDTFDEIIVVVDVSAGSAFTVGETVSAFGSNATVVKVGDVVSNQQYIWVNTVTVYPSVGITINGSSGGSGDIVQIQLGGYGLHFNNRYLSDPGAFYAKGDQQFDFHRKDLITSGNTVDRSQLRIDLTDNSGGSGLGGILANFDIDYNTPSNSKLELRTTLEVLSGYGLTNNETTWNEAISVVGDSTAIKFKLSSTDNYPWIIGNRSADNTLRIANVNLSGGPAKTDYIILDRANTLVSIPIDLTVGQNSSDSLNVYARSRFHGDILLADQLKITNSSYSDTHSKVYDAIGGPSWPAWYQYSFFNHVSPGKQPYAQTNHNDTYYDPNVDWHLYDNSLNKLYTIIPNIIGSTGIPGPASLWSTYGPITSDSDGGLIYDQDFVEGSPYMVVDVIVTIKKRSLLNSSYPLILWIIGFKPDQIIPIPYYITRRILDFNNNLDQNIVMLKTIWSVATYEKLYIAVTNAETAPATSADSSYEKSLENGNYIEYSAMIRQLI